MENIKVDIDVRALLESERAAHAEDVRRLEHQIKSLKGTLKYERERRQFAEDRLEEAKKEIVVMIESVQSKNKRRG